MSDRDPVLTLGEAWQWGDYEQAAKLGDAIDWLDERLEEGEACPCCQQRAQIYRRKITSSMARALVELYRHGSAQRGAFTHFPTLLKNAGLPRGGDEAKLAHWGLIREEDAERDDGGRAGYWRLTMRGYAFLRREISLPKYVLIYNGRRIGQDGPGVTIDDALGTKFRLDELLRGE